MDKKNVLQNLKLAEEMAEKTDNNDLKNKIYSALSIFNFISNLYEESLKYAQWEFMCAKKLGNAKFETYALINLSTIHKALGNIDSANYYILDAHKQINTVKKQDKVFFYNSIGEFYKKDNNSDIAKNYFKTSLDCKKNSIAFINLSEIYRDEGDNISAQKYEDSAMALAWTNLKIDILTNAIYREYNSTKNFDNLYKYTTQIIAAKDSLYKQDFSKQNIVFQKKFDFHKQQNYIKEILYLCLSIFLLLLVVIGFFYIIYQNRMRKTMQKNVSLVQENINMEEKIDNLKKINKENEKKIKDLTLLIDLNESKRKDIELKGIQLYDYIVKNDGKIARWDKDDFFFFIKYCEIQNPNLISIFTFEYSGLTEGEKFFLILDFMQKKDKQISYILSITEDSVRARRSKIKSKKV